MIRDDLTEFLRDAEKKLTKARPVREESPSGDALLQKIWYYCKNYPRRITVSMTIKWLQSIKYPDIPTRTRVMTRLKRMTKEGFLEQGEEMTGVGRRRLRWNRVGFDAKVDEAGIDPDLFKPEVGESKPSMYKRQVTEVQRRMSLLDQFGHTLPCHRCKGKVGRDGKWGMDGMHYAAYCEECYPKRRKWKLTK